MVGAPVTVKARQRFMPAPKPVASGGMGGSRN
jgi:hypothetical protein